MPIVYPREVSYLLVRVRAGRSDSVLKTITFAAPGLNGISVAVEPSSIVLSYAHTESLSNGIIPILGWLKGRKHSQFFLDFCGGGVRRGWVLGEEMKLLIRLACIFY